MGEACRTMTPDPAIGTWQLDLTRSTFRLFPAPISIVMNVEPWGQDGLKWRVQIVDAKRNVLEPEAAYNFDGEDYPLKGFSILADAVSAKRIDAHNIEKLWKKDGRVALSGTIVISRDGSVMTYTRRRNRAQADCDVLVYERK